MAKKGGLGRGLGALIPGAGTGGGPSLPAALIQIDDIDPNPDQPRTQFDDAELRQLADSIRLHGILQPLVVVREGDGYRLIAGERRLRAARLAGLEQVPVVFRESPQGEESLSLSLVENIQRHDLNALEEAEAYRRLLEAMGGTQEAVARQVGKTRAHVANTMRLLSLTEAVQGALLSGAISAGHARALASLEPRDQEDALRRVLREEMNVRQAEDLARERAAAAGQARVRRPRAGATDDPELRALEDRLRAALGTQVRLTRKGKGGRLVIEFYSDEELQAIFERIAGDRPI
jgi:ParB family chromosome partitioning protein